MKNFSALNIAIIDDHQLFAETLKSMLENTEPGYNIKTFVKTKDFMAENDKGFIPDIIISDILMKGKSGIEFLEEAKVLFGDACKIILLSSITDIYTVKDAFKKGAAAYISKDAKKEDILEAIEKVSAGEQYLNRALKDKLFKHMLIEEEVIFQLTPREKEVLQKICKGNTPKEISYDMKLSKHTIQQYISNIMHKFKVNRTTELVVFAIQKGLYNPDYQE